MKRIRLVIPSPLHGLNFFQQHFIRRHHQTIDATLNDSLPEPLRLAAIRLRGVSPYVVTGTGDFFQLLLGTGQSEAVQSAVITTLARYNNPNIPSGLIARWQILMPALRKQAVTALLARYDGVGEVVKALENGTIRQAEVSPTQIEFLRYYRDPTIRQHALQLFGPSTQERREALERFRPSLLLPGNTAAGRQIFLARCAACHRLGSAGQTVGPDLADARVGGKERVLSSIVQPNLAVRPDYLTFVVESKGAAPIRAASTSEP